MDDRMDRSAVMHVASFAIVACAEPKLQADRTALVDDADEWKCAARSCGVVLADRVDVAHAEGAVELVLDSGQPGLDIPLDVGDLGLPRVGLGDVELVGGEFNQRLLAPGVGQNDG